MRKRNYRFMALVTMICLVMTMTCPAGAFAAESVDDAMASLADKLAEAKGESTGASTGTGTAGSTTPADGTASAANVKLVTPSTNVKAIPDSIMDFDNPLNGMTSRDCKVTAATLWTLADRAYASGEKEFYINASHSGKALEKTSVEIETGIDPVNADGTVSSFGILTNDGYLHFHAAAVLDLLRGNTYSKVTVETETFGAAEFRIIIKGLKFDGDTETILNLPEGSVTFTVWPPESFAGKNLKYNKRWFNNAEASAKGACTWNQDGTITFGAPGTGDYTVLEDAYKDPVPEHTLDVVNEGYGFVDMDASNRYVIDAESGYYLQDVFINGVSRGPLTTITITAGDKITVIFAKLGETVDTSEYDAAAMAEKAKLEKTKAGVQNTTIKASTTTSGIKKGVKITWKKSAGYKVDYYEVWRSTKKSSGFKKSYATSSGSKTSYTNTKTTKGTRYYYRVRGVRTVGGETVYTQWSNKCYRKAK